MKTCICCGTDKALDEFYVHPRMKDGRLGRCKVCHRAAMEERRKRLESTDVAWTLAERERHRAKTAKARKEGRCRKLSLEEARERTRKFRNKYPEKTRAHRAVAYALRTKKMTRQPCHCGARAQAHHEDYSKPLDVMWLCPKHHAEHEVRMRRQKLIGPAVMLGFGLM